MATIPTKAKIKGSLSTLRRIIISGNDNPMTDIMKANAVPSDAPFSIKTETMGIIPAAFEYRGTPIKTDKGTEYQTDLPIMEAMKDSGTYPCAPAPTNIPIAT